MLKKQLLDGFFPLITTNRSYSTRCNISTLVLTFTIKKYSESRSGRNAVWRVGGISEQGRNSSDGDENPTGFRPFLVKQDTCRRARVPRRINRDNQGPEIQSGTQPSRKWNLVAGKSIFFVSDAGCGIYRNNPRRKEVEERVVLLLLLMPHRRLQMGVGGWKYDGRGWSGSD